MKWPKRKIAAALYPKFSSEDVAGWIITVSSLSKWTIDEITEVAKEQLEKGNKILEWRNKDVGL